jgi:DNA processing protein
VVSGLAAGIDGAAHVGALAAGAARPVGVVATGLDVVYPRGHRQLWNTVAERGVLVSEVPLGTPPTRWRFPARNRLIAGLARAVVVVESAETGGSMHTVEEALQRGVPVFAVPGPIGSRTSSGTNRLLADGAIPLCDVDDVLLAIDADRSVRGERPIEPPGPPGPAGQVLDALGWRPATLDQLVLRTALELGPVALAVDELEVAGWVAVDGGWVERRR